MLGKWSNLNCQSYKNNARSFNKMNKKIMYTCIALGKLFVMVFLSRVLSLK